MKLNTIKTIYQELNALNFGNVLVMPMILFTRSRDHDGSYDGAFMTFNLADTKGFEAARELVYHEMIHQYVDEFLGIKDTCHHGREFKKNYNRFSFNIAMDRNYCYGTL